MDPTTLQPWLTLATAIAAATSALAAWRSLKLNNENAQYQKEQGRPYFSFEDVRMERKKLPSSPDSDSHGGFDPSIAIPKGVFKNYGSRPAIEVSASIFLVFADPTVAPIEMPSSLADDFPPGAEWMAQIGEQTINSLNHPGYYVIVGVSYTDPLTKRNYRQLFYARWPGVTDGVVHGDIVVVGKEERLELLQKHRRLLNNYA
jgi:hypothetical protein